MKFLIILLLISTVNGINIACDFDFTDNPEISGGIYTCKMTRMDFDGNSTHILDYNGIHRHYLSNDDVKFIWIDCSTYTMNKLTNLLKGIEKIFPNFLALELTNCPIKILNGDELDEYSNLEWLSLNNLSIERIPGNFFASKSNLRYVSFASNQIYRVEESLLDNLNRLEVADFRNNLCINKFANQPSEIRELIENLQHECPDDERIKPTTENYSTTLSFTTIISTTSKSTTTTTTEQPSTQLSNYYLQIGIQAFLIICMWTCIIASCCRIRRQNLEENQRDNF